VRKSETAGNNNRNLKKRKRKAVPDVDRNNNHLTTQTA
jgi:hypothetical protein